MFVFDNVLTAGTVLVRQQIESQNWESSGHTDGWYIGSDGSASFFNVTLHGDLVSANYVADTSGYKLTYLTGSAEFNDLVARGVISSHSGTSHVDLTNTLASFAGIPGVEFFVGSGSAATVSDINAQISGATSTTLGIDGPTYDSGLNPNTGNIEVSLLSQQDASVFGPSMTIFAAQNGTAKKGSLVIDSSVALSVGFADTTFNGPVTILDASGKLFVQSFTAHQANPTGFDGPLVIGNNATAFQPLNIAIDNSRIMARNNGAVSTLFLNPAGGNVVVGSAGAGNALISGNTAGLHMTLNNNQLWALNGAAASQLFLNFSSTEAVVIGNNTAGGAQIIAVAMQPSRADNAAAGAVVITTAFSSAYSPSTGLTMTVPDSGRLRIEYSARCTLGTAAGTATAQRGLFGFQIQANNNAGAVVHAATDTESVEYGMPGGVAFGSNQSIVTMGKSVDVTGLTAGSTIFISLVTRVTSATVASTQLSNTSIIATPLP